MIHFLTWTLSVLVLSKFCGSTLSDIDLHLLHNANSTNEHQPTWIGEEESSPGYHPQYVRAASAFGPPNLEGLLAKYHAGNAQANPSSQRISHFLDAYHHSLEGRHDHRPSYQDHQPMHSIPEYDIALPLKKHDFGGGQNYGGWDLFPGGGIGMNQGSGFGQQVGQSVKTGKDAKALFILMAPLILLAVFGPILATQAMIPWVANGGLTSVSTIASGAGKRKRRSLYDPRQAAELERRLKLFLEVQDFIAKSGSANFAEEMGEAFLRCQKYTGRRNKCLERIACEYTDETSLMDPAERHIAKMVFQNVMSNPMIPASIKGRLSKGSKFGKNHRSHCRNYWCEAIDNPKAKS